MRRTLPFLLYLTGAARSKNSGVSGSRADEGRRRRLMSLAQPHATAAGLTPPICVRQLLCPWPGGSHRLEVGPQPESPPSPIWTSRLRHRRGSSSHFRVNPARPDPAQQGQYRGRRRQRWLKRKSDFYCTKNYLCLFSC